MKRKVGVRTEDNPAADPKVLMNSRRERIDASILPSESVAQIACLAAHAGNLELQEQRSLGYFRD
jgi:hypothetical protein